MIQIYKENSFINSKWIWRRGNFSSDEYVEFYFEFDMNNNSSDIIMNISCDSDYAVYINGNLSSCGQYADFPHYKIFDSIDITKFCKMGKNRCGFIIYYKGNNSSSTYYPSTPGLIFEILENNSVIVKSDSKIKSRLSNSYTNHKCKSITCQLGYTFHYSIKNEDNWLLGELDGFSDSIEINKKSNLFHRPCKKTELCERIESVEVYNKDNKHFIYDLKKEQVGFAEIEIESDIEQDLIVAYGEHLADGNVRRIINGRDFSFSLSLKKGTNSYINPFLRLGCRYLELFFEHTVKIKYVGLRPVVYPLNVVPNSLEGLRKTIYDTAIHTLICCMHEHYEDCPWREQAMYTMDSRNQMLCGYYAFNEYEFPRACLKLISESIMENNFLPICHPCGTNLVIPSFNMHFFTQVREYVDHSGDADFVKEIYHVLKRIINCFISEIEDGLIPAISDKDKWNFYEWADGMGGPIGEVGLVRKDLVLNCLFVSALKNMAYFSSLSNEKDEYTHLILPTIKKINDTFFDEEKGLYKNNDNSFEYSQLGNALAILCGASEKELSKKIANEIITNKLLTKASLSMEFFVYDALLKADFDKYKKYVLEQIDMEYEYMLNEGATTFWETLDGQKAFDLAGSLCHGWSTAPVYYYNILLKEYF